MSPVRLKGGYVTEDIRLGRIPQFDPASVGFPIRRVVGLRKRRSYTWRIGDQLDQAQTAACSGFSVSMEAAAKPTPIQGVTNKTGLQVYRRAQQLDDWPGEAYEGSSVLAAMKAGQERGWYTEYRWALGPGPEQAEHDLALAVGYHGPGVMGTWWYEGMYEADADGFLNVSGQAVGGHAWLVNAYNVKRAAYFTPNTWGGEGQGWIRRQDMVRLLAEEGEAAIPVVRRKGNFLQEATQ